MGTYFDLPMKTKCVISFLLLFFLPFVVVHAQLFGRKKLPAEAQWTELKSVKSLCKQYNAISSLYITSKRKKDSLEVYALSLMDITGKQSPYFKIDSISSDMLQIRFSGALGTDQFKNFEYKKKKDHIEIIIYDHEEGVPILYHKKQSKHLKLGLNLNRQLIIKTEIEHHGNLLFLGSGYSTDYYTIYNQYSENSGLKLIKTENALMAYQNGKPLFNETYEEIIPFKSKYFKVKKNNLWGIIKRTGEVVVPMEYDEFIRLDDSGSSEIFFISKDQKKGIINTNGHIILPAEFDSASRFNADFFEYSLHQKQGLVSENGDLVYPPIYSYLGWISSGTPPWERYLDGENKYIAAKRDGKNVIIDREGYEYDPVKKMTTFQYGQQNLPNLSTARKTAVKTP